MKRIILSLIFISLIFSINSFAQKISEQDKAVNEINDRGEVNIKFELNSPQLIFELSKKMSIEDIIGNEITANLNLREFQNFLEYGIAFQIIDRPSAPKTTVATTVAEMASWDRFASYDVLNTMMNQFETDYPNICRIENIGNSTDGRQMLVAKISDNVDTDEDEPEFLYTGNMHGDEIVAYALFFQLIDYMLSNYGSDPQITNLINNVEIWINPCSNPDGLYNGGNDNVSSSTRRNAQNIDLNRNYPSMTDGLHPDGEIWGTETIHFMNFADAHDFVMSANSHSGAEVLNYPWDHWTSGVNAHADDNWWQYVSNIYATLAQADAATVGMPSYLTGVSSNGYTEGGDWYVITGSRQDWMMYYKNCRENTFEWSNTKLIAASTLPNYWTANKQAMLDYMDEVLYGIRGIITDGCTGQPMIAKVEIIGHDEDNSEVYSSLPIGNYHRPILAGTYNVTYSAAGYVSQTINGITVTNGNTVIQNITLMPDANITANFSANETTSCNGTIDFTCLTSGADSWSWDFGDSGTSTDENPTHNYAANGTYTVTLTVTNCGGINSDSEVKTNYITINAPAAPTTTSGSRCGTGTVDLSASGSGGDLDWYDVPSGGSLLYTGTNYTTPSLSSTTTYYVTNHLVNIGSSQYVGKTDNAGTGGNHTTSGYGLYFDVLQNMQLASIYVYASVAGDRNIQILDGSSAVIYDQNITIPDGESRITIDIDLPPGTDYTLKCNSTPNLYRDGGFGAPDLPYPYEISGLISITGNPANDVSYYYYFYDWEVKEISDCSSARTPVTATIESELPVSVSVSVAEDTICVGGTAIFSAAPTNGGTSPNYEWFVNGSSEQNGGSNSFSTSTINEGDIITCELTSSESCNDGPATSNSVTIHTTTGLAVSVSVSASSSTICLGENVTFTASPTNGGTLPDYEWFVNSSSVQTGSSNTYATTLLADGDIVSCILTSSENCNDGPTSSNNITMTVLAGVPVGISIDASVATICTGDNIDFTATPTNGGTTPNYEWFVNGSSVQSGSNDTYSTTVLADGDIVTCEITSSEFCVTGNPATSNSITMTVSSSLPVSNSVSGNTNFCAGDNVIITATTTNEGTTPIYEWFVNGSSVQTGTNDTYSSASFNDGDEIYCIVTSSLSCATANPATSNTLTMTVSTSLPVSLNVSGSNPICDGESVIYTATPTNGGATPNYEWFVNGISVQTGTNDTYTSSGFIDNDIISCVITSSASCATGNPATSNSIIINVNANLPVNVNIMADVNPICADDNVIFTANPLNGGTTPVYQWQVNGSDVGTNSSTYSSTTLSNGDFVSCILTSSETCIAGSPASSNNIIMNVDDVPVADFTYVDNELIVSFTNTSVDATTYMWYFGDGNSTNMPDPTHVYPGVGLYTVMLIASNNCGSDTTTIDINIIIDNIKDINLNNSLSIFPNPTTGELNIVFETYNNTNINLEIHSILGKLITNRTIKNAFGKYNEVFDMSIYDKGIYLLIINTDNSRTVKKIVLE